LVTFGVALGVTLGLGGLTYLVMNILKMMLYPDNSTAYFASYSITSSLFMPITFVLSFFIFYQFGKKAKISIFNKAIILALFVGLLIGDLITRTLSTSSNLPLTIYISLIASSSFASAFQYLFPPLAGLVYAEIKEKKSSQKLVAEPEKIGS
jgi:hypothetical protein